MNPTPSRAASPILVMGLLIHLAAGCANPGSRGIATLDPALRDAGPRVASVTRDPAPARFQVLVSEVVEGRDGRPPRLRRHGYRVDAEYFYPASSIKLCAAVAALQELEALEASHGVGGLADAPMEIDPLFPGDEPQKDDPSHLGDGRITVAHEIRKLALVSDNPAFNRLYDLVGHEGLNRSMHALGLRSAVINHRLSEARPIPDPMASAAVTLHPAGGPIIAIPARTSPLRPVNSAPGLQVGSAHLRGERHIPEPMDFTRRNGISLVDLQDLLVKVVRPDIPLPGAPLRLSPGHRALLIDALTRYPRESADPRYDPATHPDGHVKFLLPGVRRVLPEAEPGRRVEIAAKIGRAYGFTVENSHLHHPGTGRSVFVTAVLYTNADGVLNDDRYEYEELADPLFADLGEWVARTWLAAPPDRGTPP